MQSIYKVVKAMNNQVIIDLPPGFEDREVEVILRSPDNQDTRIREIEKEIDIGLKSPISPRTHKEVFDSLREKYGSC